MRWFAYAVLMVCACRGSDAERIRVEKHANGALAAQGPVAGGRRDGTWTFWSESGRKIAVRTFARGDLSGPSFVWSEQGELLEAGTFANGKRSGFACARASDSTRMCAFYRNDVLNGWLWAWRASGRLERTEGWANGLRDGPYVHWHPNGAPAESGLHLEDKQHGRVTAWNQNGIRVADKQFDQGRPVGTWTTWRDDGSLESQGTWDGEPIGEWKYWNADGSLARVVKRPP